MVILSDLSLDLVAIFTSWDREPLLMDSSPQPSFLFQEFYVNIYDVSGSTFRVFLRGSTVKITPYVISNIVHTPQVIHPLFPYLSVNTILADSLFW